MISLQPIVAILRQAQDKLLVDRYEYRFPQGGRFLNVQEPAPLFIDLPWGYGAGVAITGAGVAGGVPVSCSRSLPSRSCALP